MTCCYCSHQFCFVCLLPWDGDFHDLDGCSSYGDPTSGYNSEGYEIARGLHRKSGYDREGFNRMNQNRPGYARGDTPIDHEPYDSDPDYGNDNESNRDYSNDSMSDEDYISDHGDDDGGFDGADVDQSEHESQHSDDEGMGVTDEHISDDDVNSLNDDSASANHTNNDEAVLPLSPDTTENVETNTNEDHDGHTHATEDEATHPPQNEGDELHIPELVSQAPSNASSIAPPPPTFNDPSFAQLDCTHKWKYQSIYKSSHSV
jgi:hypothetical protein